jgi:two-component system, sensor histidine kinase SagS
MGLPVSLLEALRVSLALTHDLVIVGDGTDSTGGFKSNPDDLVVRLGVDALSGASWPVTPSTSGSSPVASVFGSETAPLALLNAIGEATCLAASDGTVLWANDRFRSMDEPARARVIELCREAAAWFLDQISAGRLKGPMDRRAEIAITETGKIYDVIVSPELSSLPDSDGPGGAPFARVAASIRDVTTDRRLKRKLDAIDLAGSELTRFDADAVRRMNVFERLQLVENKIIRACKELLNYDHFVIRLIDRKSTKLEMVISSGLPQEAAEIEMFPSTEGNGISGYVAATGRSYICPDTEKDPRFLPGLAGARSSLTVPLRLHDKVVGTFDIESQQVAAFGENDRQFTEIFGRYIALALNMLDLLVVERSATNETITGMVEGEIREPLQHILEETEWLKTLATRDPEVAKHLDRIKGELDTIRSKVRNVGHGPQTLLGVEEAMNDRRREPLLEGKRILVADDEPNMRRLIHDILHNRGCIVEVFENGAQAIAAIDEVKAGIRAPYKLVLSDIKMPDKNGYEVFAAARAVLPGVPVILMTGFGYDPHHSIVRASQEGLQSVLFKPFQVERLLEDCRKAMGAG